MHIIKIYNDYSYLSGYAHPAIIEACTLIQHYWYKRKYILKDTANYKYHIDNYRKDFRLTRLVQAAESANKQYAVPLRKSVTYRNSINIITVNFPDQKKKIYFNSSNGSFPTGWLFSKVVPVLKEKNILYKLEDYRGTITSSPLNAVFPFELRDYQIEAYQRVINKERGILDLPTGSGKSAIAAKILSHYGLPTLYIVPSLNLIYQTAEVFSGIFGEEYIGFRGDGKSKEGLIVVATQQTLWSRKDTKDITDLFSRTKVLILDEAHKVEKTEARSKSLGNTWYQIAMRCFNARIRVAMSATPGKEGSFGRMLLEAVTGKEIYKLLTSDLIKQDYLSKPTFYIYTIPIKSKIKNWQSAYTLNICKNKARNRKIVSHAKRLAKKGKSVLIVVDRIERHGQVLMEMLGDAAESLYGKDKSDIRLDVLQRFKAGKLKILLSTLIKEGVDLPEMDAIIMANAGAGGVNGRKTVQTIGRCLRKTAEKNQAIIIDFFDDDGGILKRHSEARMSIYKSEPEFEVIFKEM